MNSVRRTEGVDPLAITAATNKEKQQRSYMQDSSGEAMLPSPAKAWPPVAGLGEPPVGLRPPGARTPAAGLDR